MVTESIKKINREEFKIAFKIFLFFLSFYSLIFLFLFFIGKIPDFCISDECAYFENAKNIFQGNYQDPLKDRLVPPGFSLLIAPFFAKSNSRSWISFSVNKICFFSLNNFLSFLSKV